MAAIQKTYTQITHNHTIASKRPPVPIDGPYSFKKLDKIANENISKQIKFIKESFFP